MTTCAITMTALNDLAVITLTGSDATTFLQAQLTQDMAALGPDKAALAGYCTARGRLFASMVAVQQGDTDADGWLLITKADAALAFGQRLRMFVLRAKVDIEISETGVIGVRHCAPVPDAAGTTHGTATDAHTPAITVAGAPVSADTLTVPDAAPAYSVVRQNGQIWISVPQRDNAPEQRWWVLNADTAITPDDAANQAWQADDIAAGLPWIQAATQEAFIPQTVNMDLIGGVSFTKGCYPGQEVVARSHYRGTIKRRMAYARTEGFDGVDVHALPGADTFDANQPGRPSGRVVNAAINSGTLHVLMEVQLADLDTAAYRLGDENGPAVTVVSLPYSITPQANS
ncbi:MAG TPA: folate-binding protein [Burkholderiaceae bacterium]|nr:folate-binding protein [Burkholderiaceae bacterium]